jgi:hypothetical protein
MVTELAMLLGSSLEELHLLVLWFSSVCDFYLRLRLLTDAAVVRVSACCQKCNVLDLDDTLHRCSLTWPLIIVGAFSEMFKVKVLVLSKSLDDFELLNIFGGFYHCYGLLLHADSAPISLVTCQKTGCKLEGK